MNREFFNEHFAALIAAYVYAQKAPEEGQDVYWEMLRDMPEANFSHAVRSCLAGCKFFPTIAELIEAGKAMPRPERKLLAEPPATPEQLAAGLKLLRETSAKLAAKFSMK